MYLKELELAGFKSFAKKATLRFKTPITAIVGPNGSGKSNIAEAFRFALGEQRITHMRGKRTSDLIWNGSPKLPRANRAHVKLIFDNRGSGKKLFNFDFDEVTLERTIFHDASTEYRINGSPARLRDIVELLAEAHIGSSGHHIISQGETDLILTVHPRERRGMVEDALGLKIYQYKKEESERKLLKVEANMREAELLRREIKPHLAFLKKQTEKIEKARVMREELQDLYARYLKDEETILAEEEKILTARRTPLEKNENEIADKLKRAEDVMRSLSGKEEASEKARYLKEHLAKLQHEKEQTSRELGKIEGVIEAEEERASHERDSSFVSVPRAKIDALEEGMADITRGMDEEDSTVLQRALELLKKLIGDFLDLYGGVKRGGEREEIAALDKKRERVQGKISEIESKIKIAEEEVARLEKHTAEEYESFRGAERAAYELRARISEIRVELERIKGKEEGLELEKEELAREKKEAEALIGEYALRSVAISPNEGVLREVQAKRKKEIERLKIRLEDAGTSSGEDVMKEYRDVEERDQYLEKELSDLSNSKNSLTALIAELEEKILEEFKVGLEKINAEFRKLFSLMFGGGEASLFLVKTEPQRRTLSALLEGEIPEDGESEEAEEGVLIHVSLPRKKIHGLQMLSGGERALTSAALLFAMSGVNPPPFLILDETDAALDEANSKRYGDMIEELAKKSELILITHNRETMSRAGVLYGVTMGPEGVSELLSVDFVEAMKVAK